MASPAYFPQGGTPELRIITMALVRASQLLDEDPERVARGAPRSRARWMALAVLVDLFPSANRTYMVSILGGGPRYSGAGHLRAARKAKWWKRAHFHRVRQAVRGSVPESNILPFPGARPSP